MIAAPGWPHDLPYGGYLVYAAATCFRALVVARCLRILGSKASLASLWLCDELLMPRCPTFKNHCKYRANAPDSCQHPRHILCILANFTSIPSIPASPVPGLYSIPCIPCIPCIAQTLKTWPPESRLWRWACLRSGFLRKRGRRSYAENIADTVSFCHFPRFERGLVWMPGMQ